MTATDRKAWVEHKPTFRHSARPVGRGAVMLLALIVGIVAVPVFGNSASAEVYQCNGSESNYHAGYYQAYGTGSYEGAYATLVTRYGAVCDTDTSSGNFTNSYTMIASQNGYGWQQSGFIRWYGSNTVYFAQTYDGGSGLYTKYGTTALTDGSSNTYYQQYIAACACEKSLINGSVWQTSTFDPYKKWTGPFSPQFEAETAYLQSDIPGNDANPVTWTNIHGQASSTNDWESYPCSTLTHSNDGSAKRSDGEAWYARADGTCPNFETFTDTAGL